MDCCRSRDDREQIEQQKIIERELKHDAMRAKSEIKLLLLGAGESGKSTFVKQMQIIHGSGYSDDQKKKFIKVICQNVFTAMQSIIKAMEKLELQYSDPSSSEHANLIKNVDFKGITTLESQYSEAVKALWADSGVQHCYSRKREYQLIDSAKYYFDEIDRISMEDYVPTEQDILRSRASTTGIVEYKFDLEQLVFRIIDVGGQRSERRKWIHCFENVTTNIFLVALSEYDQSLYESEVDNRLHESNALFKTLVTSKWFKKTPVILFFNKMDIFEEKIMMSDLKDFFPEYNGPTKDPKDAKEYIRKLFKLPGDGIYSHFTCATDTENIKIVFATVKDTILNTYLNLFNLT